MLAKAGSDTRRNSMTGLDRHLGMLTRFIEQSQTDIAPGARDFTLILRSAVSDPAQALISTASELGRAGIRPRIVLAKTDGSAEFRQLIAVMTDLCGKAALSDHLRWAKNPRLLDAHEQVTCGNQLCWSGDAMSRDPSRRNALSLFAEDRPEMVRLAALGFTALWHAATPVPASRLFAGERSERVSMFETPAEDGIEVPLLRPTFFTSPSSRH